MPATSSVDALAAEIAPLGAPVMVFCASHSGSRLLVQALTRLGVFMGARLNDSEDSLDIFDLVRWLVMADAGDFERLLSGREPELRPRVLAALSAHLVGRPPAAAWGWKLPETANVLPLMRRLFPKARLVHLVRDGRDVAFSPFVAPKDPFWRKIYFGDERLASWRGLPMTQRAYRAHGHLFNAARWVRSVTLGREGGAGASYLEIRYESLVASPTTEIVRLADFLELSVPALRVDASHFHSRSVGKWRT
ncbi:MAG: sulfotransferase family protein, partial [Caulobacteraceae bacterium]